VPECSPEFAQFADKSGLPTMRCGFRLAAIKDLSAAPAA
jgi:hypothetical protein